MSPEDQRVWEEDAETEYAEAHAQARPATHSPADAEKVSQDVGEVERARVARYAEAIYRASRVVDVPEWIRIARFDLARPVIAVADSELASVVAENERLREQSKAHHSWAMSERRLTDAALKLRNAAEAEVERLRVRLAKVEAPDVTWRCSACGWVASEDTIDLALWHERDRTVSMVCPECSAEGSFVDHEPLVEHVSALVHEAWMATKRSQGVTSRPSEWGEEQMVPYDQLSERAKDLDRGSVRAVLDALRAVLADAPTEQTKGGDDSEGFCTCDGPEHDFLIALSCGLREHREEAHRLSQEFEAWRKAKYDATDAEASR